LTFCHASQFALAFFFSFVLNFFLSSFDSHFVTFLICFGIFYICPLLHPLSGLAIMKHRQTQDSREVQISKARTIYLTNSVTNTHRSARPKGEDTSKIFRSLLD
jgi:hypothetical protein